MKFHAKNTILITIIAVIALFALPLDQISGNEATVAKKPILPSFSSESLPTWTLSNSSLQNDIRALNNTAYTLGKKIVPSLLFSKAVLDASALYRYSGFQYYLNKLGSGNLQWGVEYNFTNGNFTLYAEFVLQNKTTQTYYTFGVPSNTLRISGPIKNSQSRQEYGTYYTSTNWGGYEFYNTTNDPYSDGVIYSNSADINVVNINSPPSSQISGKFMSVSAWIGLTEFQSGESASGIHTLAQTGYYREYYKDSYQFWTGPYWHNYHIWYETISPNNPQAPTYNYPGSPDLTPGWEIKFTVTNDLPDFTYSAYISNTSQDFTVTSTNGNFNTYYAQYITEAAKIGYITQLGQFYPSVHFEDTLLTIQSDQGYPFQTGLQSLYSNGYYNEYYLHQSTSNGFNVINSFGPAMTWSNSYYDYSYVN